MKLTRINNTQASEAAALSGGGGGDEHKRVRFDEQLMHHEPVEVVQDDRSDLWYTQAELAQKFQADLRETRDYFLEMTKNKADTSSTKEPTPVIDVRGDDEHCTRGMEVLSSDERTRLTRCALFRALLIKQYGMFHALLSEEDASNRLQTFASKNSEWAKERASALALQDAAEARKIYREAAKEDAAKKIQLGVVPSARKRLFGRGLRRQPQRAPSA